MNDFVEKCRAAAPRVTESAQQVMVALVMGGIAIGAIGAPSDANANFNPGSNPGFTQNMEFNQSAMRVKVLRVVHAEKEIVNLANLDDQCRYLLENYDRIKAEQERQKGISGMAGDWKGGATVGVLSMLAARALGANDLVQAGAGIGGFVGGSKWENAHENSQLRDAAQCGEKAREVRSFPAGAMVEADFGGGNTFQLHLPAGNFPYGLDNIQPNQFTWVDSGAALAAADDQLRVASKINQINESRYGIENEAKTVHLEQGSKQVQESDVTKSVYFGAELPDDFYATHVRMTDPNGGSMWAPFEGAKTYVLDREGVCQEE